jgi:small subunit ribosomal protein S15
MSELKPEKEVKKQTKPSWIKIKPAELQKIVVDLSKEGNTPAKIGLILRDKHGIPKTKLLGKKITQLLKEAGEEVKPESKFVEERIEKIKSHLTKNKHDYSASRALTKQLWKIHKLKKIA